jgi:hypothetical protein
MTAEHATPHHPGDVENETHGIGDHGEDHGHDDHGHETDTLGPVDTQAWGAFALGILLGLVVAWSIAISVGGLPA